MLIINHAHSKLSTSDIPKLEFNDKDEFELAITMFEREDIVYLLVLPNFFDEEYNIIVTSNYRIIEEELTSLSENHPWENDEEYDDEIHLHEYNSFEEAYQTALYLREDSKLCYSKTSEE